MAIDANVEVWADYFRNVLDEESDIPIYDDQLELEALTLFASLSLMFLPIDVLLSTADHRHFYLHGACTNIIASRVWLQVVVTREPDGTPCIRLVQPVENAAPITYLRVQSAYFAPGGIRYVNVTDPTTDPRHALVGSFEEALYWFATIIARVTGLEPLV